jgi:hypothetical protein
MAQMGTGKGKPSIPIRVHPRHPWFFIGRYAELAFRCSGISVLLTLRSFAPREDFVPEATTNDSAERTELKDL